MSTDFQKYLDICIRCGYNEVDELVTVADSETNCGGDCVFLKTHQIERILAEKGLTKTALSVVCGISRQGVSVVMKRGTCRPQTAQKLAAGLGVPLDEIIYQTEVILR